ncbi:MAG TPA: DnaA regulatory inactivator Hda [Steroidobacter sp.]|uniref:DnaA regulatory inactivator Hda n=1 Tax=Steroidobacter sp. TaxID=1978227 RepID=UPI002ED81641
MVRSPGQLPLGIRLPDSSVFESYFAGRNQPVVDALLTFLAIESRASKQTGTPTCIWIHGAQGTGKTHLLQAVCARASREGRSAAYLPLPDVISLGEEVLAGFGDLSVVCLDDAQVIAGRENWERALFRLHQELQERDARLLVSGATPPAALPFKLRDLGSRLNGGLVLTLQALDEPEQISALQLRAQLRGLELPDETAQFMLRRLPRDMTHLYAVLDELDAASLIAQRRLTVPFVKEVLERRLAD